MKYQVRIIPSAERDMDRLPALVHRRISTKVLLLEDNPRPPGMKKLSAREEYRFRVGDYRLSYTIDDKEHVVTALAVGHRRDVYR